MNNCRKIKHFYTIAILWTESRKNHGKFWKPLKVLENCRKKYAKVRENLIFVLWIKCQHIHGKFVNFLEISGKLSKTRGKFTIKCVELKFCV